MLTTEAAKAIRLCVKQKNKDASRRFIAIFFIARRTFQIYPAGVPKKYPDVSRHSALWLESSTEIPVPWSSLYKGPPTNEYN